ncbi:MAG: citramalate synthase [Nanoarchaeota archaeon]
MIKIFDTTLRDGTQSPDVNLSMPDKLEIVKTLDDFGIDYLELGWPGSNPKDMETFLEASKFKLKNSQIVAFGATRRMGINAQDDKNLQAILESKADVACIFGKTWIEHVEKQLKSNAKDNLTAIEDSIKFLKKNKLKVFYDLEHFFDGFKDNKKYALDCIKTAADAGADCLIMCDTNGGSLPEEIRGIIKEVKEFMDIEKIKAEFGMHAHNDSGFAVANTLEAVNLGATHVQGTINGFGERAGNADLCQLIPNLALKKKLKLNVKLKDLQKVSDLVYILTNVKPNNHQPFVGRNAFRHKGGIHVDAIMKGASYEHMDPALIGNKREIVLSDLSGKANIIEVLKKFEIRADKNDPRVLQMLKEVEKLEKSGYDIGNLEVEQYLLAQKFFAVPREFFTIDTWKVMSEQRNGEFSESVITGKVNGKDRQVVAAIDGGPVDAMYKSLQRMIATHYKDIKTIKLVNYKVMIAEDKGAESSVRVYIKFQNESEEWGTVGVSPNILEASLEAIEKGFRYYLLKNY